MKLVFDILFIALTAILMSWVAYELNDQWGHEVYAGIGVVCALLALVICWWRVIWGPPRC